MWYDLSAQSYMWSFVVLGVRGFLLVLAVGPDLILAGSVLWNIVGICHIKNRKFRIRVKSAWVHVFPGHSRHHGSAQQAWRPLLDMVLSIGTDIAPRPDCSVSCAPCHRLLLVEACWWTGFARVSPRGRRSLGESIARITGR